MAITKVVLPLFLILSSLFLVLPRSCNAYLLKTCGFDAIYQLGDSISDTGNLIIEDPTSVFARLPYGETYFKKATGRCSNGLLMIDYLAQSAGIPFLDAYLNPNAIITRGRGLNFAVAGATALPAVGNLASSPWQREILPFAYNRSNSSLSTQLDWMFTHFNSICYNNSDCVEKLKTALFMVGEIGGNDYNYPLLQGKTLEEVKAMVPQVVQAIKDAVTRVIGYGAIKVVVPGNFPIGCLPVYLTEYNTNNSAAYDEFHCLKDLNNFSIYHNEHLQQAIEELKKGNPNVIIVYGDYYNAFQWILRHVQFLGFDVTSVQKACCGIGGDYDFSLVRMCGTSGVPVCPDPDKHISWDGVHLTQMAYQYMAQWLINDIFPKLQCNA